MSRTIHINRFGRRPAKKMPGRVPARARQEFRHDGHIEDGQPRGKRTPVTKLFCSRACGACHRRMHPSAPRSKNAKNVPVKRAFAEPVLATEGQAEYGPCLTCGRMNRISTPGPLFCNDRCRDYVPLRPRKPDGAWFIVAGPVDYCTACATAITPRKPHGDLTPYRKDGRLYCGCAQKRQKAGAALRVQS
jgi:hypothetical protein